MSATSAPFGFSAREYIGGKFNYYTRTYPIQNAYATAIGQGDPVVLVGGYLTKAIPNSGTTSDYTVQILGIFQNVTYYDTTNTLQPRTYWAANTSTYNSAGAIATVDVTPNVVYSIQANGALTSAALGKNYSFLATSTYAPNTKTGQSQAVLDIGNGGTAAYIQLKIVGLTPIPNNNWTDAYPVVDVIINNHSYKPGTVGQ